MATLAVALQKYLYTHANWAQELSWFDYQPAVIWLTGPLFGAGALLADAAESFFKRQRNIAPGHVWFPFDQMDYIIGGCIFSLPVVQLSATQYLWVLLAWAGMHLLTVYVGYQLGVREKPI